MMRHDTICYDSAEHLVGVAAPFLLAGVAAGEATLVSLSDCTADLIRAALPPGDDVTFLSGAYQRPAAAIREYHRLFAGLVAAGAPGIRVIGELPRATFGPAWDGWARYESAVNRAWDEFPIWSVCVYDTRVTPEGVLADVWRTHQRSFLPGGRFAANPGYTEPGAFLREPRMPRPDPLEGTAPLVALTDPSARDAREAVRGAHGAMLADRALDGLLLATTETVTNAHQHGTGPVRLRVWRGPDRVVVTVGDDGTGPADPFAGLLPVAGHGLWLSHLFCDRVTLDRGPAGFTIRLTAQV